MKGALIDAQLASVRKIMSDGYPSIFIRSNEEAADAALAVVREHLPVRPDRETVARALYDASGGQAMSHLDRGRLAEMQADAVLDLFPGRSEAEVKAEAWDEAVDTLSRHWEDVIPTQIADLERRNPYREGAR